MDLSLAALFTLPFLIFCMIIYLVTQVFRKVVEFLAKKLSKASHFVLYLVNKLPFVKKKLNVNHIDKWFFWVWRENVLPAAPLVIGGLTAFLVKDYPYPELFGESITARTFLGVFAGLVCIYIYPRAMFYIKKFTSQKVDDAADQVSKND